MGGEGMGVRQVLCVRKFDICVETSEETKVFFKVEAAKVKDISINVSQFTLTLA